jgi:hypothetical protein
LEVRLAEELCAVPLDFRDVVGCDGRFLPVVDLGRVAALLM